MPEQPLWTFFYGSYMNFDVLREIGVQPAQWEVARLGGFRLVIRPRANLLRSERDTAYGIVAACTHTELGRLYAHAESVLGERYLPEAVLVEAGEGRWRPALCYIASGMEPRPADRAYVDRIVKPARQYGFPAWYVEHIESFR